MPMIDDDTDKKENDRVRLLKAFSDLPVGALGTVKRGWGGWLAVEFDQDERGHARMNNGVDDVIDICEIIKQ